MLGFSTLSVVWVVESLLATSLALFGIGLGWNFTLLAATAELTDKTVAVERGKIIGFGDLFVVLLSAVLATLGGLALSTIGLLGVGVAGLTVAVAPALWILCGEAQKNI